MKNMLKITFLLFFSILIASCEKKINKVEFEKNVLSEIFPEIVDSICIDYRKMKPPPRFEIETRNLKNKLTIDTPKGNNKKTIEYHNWKKEQNRVANDTSEIIIGFDQYLLNFGEKRVYNGTNLYNSSFSNFKFDYSKIKLNNKFKIKNCTEFPKAEKLILYELKYNFLFGGFLSISRIKFDKNQKSGVLEASFSYCGKCGRGYLIYIKETNGKWKIDKVEGTWIS